MSLISSVKLLLRFNDTSLLDDASGDQFSVSGDSTVSIKEDGSGLELRRDQKIFNTSASLGISNKLSIGFWMTEKHPGVARNPSSGLLESMNISVLDFGEGDVSPYTGELEVDVPSLSIQQQALENGKFRLLITMEDSLGSKFVATSSDYDDDKPHHFWISWDGSGSVFKLFIDGVEDDIKTSGNVLSSISGSFVVFSINRLAFGSSFNSINSDGIIDDIIVLNDFIDNTETVQKVVNFSVDFAFDNKFMDVSEVDYAVLFNDTSPVAVTDAFDDGVFFFVTRNDGKILRGTPLLWEVRRNFSNVNEKEVLDTFGTGVEIIDGELKITKGTLRL